MSPVGDGLVRLRTNQLGKQTVFGTAVAATRRMPWKGIGVYDPNRTALDVDTGSIGPNIPPIAGAPNISWTPTGPMFYNEQPTRAAACLKGGVTPTGATAKTWVYQIASLTADPFEYFTLETGDDTSATDGMQFRDGVIDTYQETVPEDLGVLTFSDTWAFAQGSLATNRTGALTVDSAPTPIMGDESNISIDVAPGSMGITVVNNALHGLQLSITNNLDKKRLANGSNSRRAYAGYARGARQIELVLTFAKEALPISERATLTNAAPSARYIRFNNISQSVITGTATPYSYQWDGAFKLYNAADSEIGGNATLILTYHAFYDSTLTYAYKQTIVN